jgi:hypothetical protein
VGNSLRHRRRPCVVGARTERQDEDKDAKPANRRAQVINQLTKETGIELAVRTPTMLCVPSLKRLLQ